MAILILISKIISLVIDVLCQKFLTWKTHCDSEGLMPTVAGIAGTIQANEVIKSILQIKSDLIGSMMIFNAI